MNTELKHDKRQVKTDLVDLIKIGGIYYHYKNKTHHYRVLTIACNTTDLEWTVVYEALYNNPVSKVWCRSLEEFLNTVTIDTKIVPRFTLLK